MPALPDVPQVLRLNFHFHSGENLVAKCRKFIQYSGTAPTNAQCDAIAVAASTAFHDHLLALLGSGLVMSGVEVTDLTSPTAGIGSGSSTNDGARTGGTLPFNIALLESQKVHRRYRGGHSRVYWPLGVRSDLHDTETWDGTFISDATADLAAFNTALKAITWTTATIVEIVNVSFYNGFHVVTGSTGRARNVSLPRVTPLVDAVVSSIFQAGIATVRKRLLGLA